MCNKTLGDATDWDEQTLALLTLAKPHLISGALRGVFLGDELSAQGTGAAPHDPTALSFRDIERCARARGCVYSCVRSCARARV